MQYDLKKTKKDTEYFSAVQGVQAKSCCTSDTKRHVIFFQTHSEA